MLHSISPENWKEEYSNYLSELSKKLDDRLSLDVTYHDRVWVEIEGEENSYYIGINGVKAPRSRLNVPKLRYSERVELILEDNRAIETQKIEDKNLEQNASSIEKIVRELEENPPKDWIDQKLDSGGNNYYKDDSI